MLKRHQVLLEDWITDHLKQIAEKYDLSFSEVIRVMVCVQIPINTKVAYPQFSCEFNGEELKKAIKANNRGEADVESFHKLLSKIYFEARKAIEFWEEEEKKRMRKAKK